MVSGRVVPGRILLHIDSGSHDMETYYPRHGSSDWMFPSQRRSRIETKNSDPKKEEGIATFGLRTWAVDAVSAVDSLLMAETVEMSNNAESSGGANTGLYSNVRAVFFERTMSRNCICTRE
jgi:hypothetical protein